MSDQSIPRARILRIYDTARQSLDVLASIEHAASNLDLDPVLIESVVQGREAGGTFRYGGRMTPTPSTPTQPIPAAWSARTTPAVRTAAHTRGQA